MDNLFKSELLNLFRVKNIKALFITFFLFVTVFSILVYQKSSSDTNVNRRERFFVAHYVEGFFVDLEKTISLVGNSVRLFGNTHSRIEEILSNFSKMEISYLLGSYVSWADADGNVVVSGKKGILLHDEVKNLSSRPCFKLSKEEGGLLRLSSPTKNMFNSRVVLPTTMMICDEHNKTLGFMVLGLNIDNLINHLRTFLSEDGVLKITFNRDGVRVILTLLDYKIEQVQRDSDKFISVSSEKKEFSVWRTFLSDYFLYFLLLFFFLCFIYVNNKIIQNSVLDPVFLILGQKEKRHCTSITHLHDSIQIAHNIIKSHNQTIKFYSDTKKSYKAIIRFGERTYSNFYKKFDIVRAIVHTKLLKNPYHNDKDIIDVIKLIDNFDRDMFAHSVKEFSLHELVLESIEMFYEKAQKDGIKISIFNDKHIEHKVFVGSDLKYLHIFKSIMNLSLNMIMSNGNISINVVYSGANKAIVFVSVSGNLVREDFHLNHVNTGVDKALCQYGCVNEIIDMAKDFNITVFYESLKADERVFKIMVQDNVQQEVQSDIKGNVVRLF